MTAKRKVLAAAAAIHLALAALHAPHILVEPHLPHALDRAIAYYGAFSGVHTHFDFFAPWISTESRLELRLHGADGAVRVVRLSTPDREVNNRIATMLTQFGPSGDREALLKAWARYAFRLYPDAVAVEPRLEILVIPTLPEAAAGARPRWAELGRGRFQRSDTGGT